MNYTNSSHPHVPGADWQILGKLELPVGTDSDAPIRAWLADILLPLRLHQDFMDKVLKSAQDAAARSIQAEMMHAFEHIHLLVFAPRHNDSNEKTWGFFRIEKAGTFTAKEKPDDHSIEFYLYLEG
ncbi:MAG TPA: hypothetical protein VJ821_12695 [Anaerolineales bacterium]|nr:hypothetical protein [Anaerolineales bacterium]